MRHLRSVRLKGLDEVHEILITDERKALLAAQAAGRAVVAVRLSGGRREDLWPARYLVEDITSPDDIETEYLEQILRRHLNLPWEIVKTARLTVRELTAADIPELYRLYGRDDLESAAAPLDDDVAIEQEKLLAYQKNMYGFFGYGLWGLYLIDGGRELLVGRAGFQNLDYRGQGLPEISFQIKPGWRRLGLCEEAVAKILEYGFEVLGFPAIYARVDEKNTPSRNLLKKLGFQPFHEYVEGDERMLIQIKR